MVSDIYDGGFAIGFAFNQDFGDSMMELGEHRDRHDNIGDGEIGTDGFKVMMEQPALQGRAWLLEVPGIEGDGPDLENVNRLKQIRDGVLG